MDRVLLQVTRKQDRRQLEDWLGKTCQLIVGHRDQPFEGEFDLVILDGPSLKRLRKEVQVRRKVDEPVFLPFLLLTMRRRGNVPAKHLGKLVDDLIVRPLHEKEIQARVANLLRMRRWSVGLKREHDRVMKLAVTDDVTGFHNTRYLHRYLDRVIDPANPKPTDVSLVFFDLDNFKRLVDTHGHLLGSKTLKEVAQAVALVLGEDDRLIRYGGDEFIVVLPRQTKQEAVLKVSAMRQAIASTAFLQTEGIHARLTASFGVAAYPQDAKDKRQLLLEADRCLFRSKTEGKDRVTLAELQPAA